MCGVKTNVSPPHQMLKQVQRDSVAQTSPCRGGCAWHVLVVRGWYPDGRRKIATAEHANSDLLHANPGRV